MAYQPNSPWPYRGGALNGNARDVSYGTTVGGSYSTFFTYSGSDGSISSVTPVIDVNGTVYLSLDYYISSQGNNTLYAIQSNGSILWHLPDDTFTYPISSPVIASDGSVYVIGTPAGYYGDDHNHLYKIPSDAYGTVTPTIIDPTSSTPAVGISSSPAIGNNNILYVGGYSFFAYDLTTSSLLWNSTNGIYFSSPAIASDGTVYIANASYSNGTLCAFAPTQPVDLSRNATPLWTSVGLSLQTTSPVIGTDGSIYLLTRDALVALDPCSNPLTDPVSPKWTYPLSLSTTRSTSPAVGQNGCIYVTTLSELVVISPSGDLLASTGALGTFATVPCVGINPSTGDDLVYCGYLPNNNPPYTVVAYNYSDSTLSLVFSQALGSSSYEPSLDQDTGFALDANGILYIPGYNNQLYKIHDPVNPPVLVSGSFDPFTLAARVVFTPPAMSVTSYLYSTDGGTTYQSTTNLNSPLVLYGLTQGPAYPIYMKSVNALGTSGPSNLLTLDATPPPPCFGKGTDILSYQPSNRTISYRKIEDLREGDWVPVYKNPPMQIKTIVQGTFHNDPATWHQCMYKMAKRHGMTNDLYLTGGHALLVDSLTPEQFKQQYNHIGCHIPVEDKIPLLVKHAPHFEPIPETAGMIPYYHVVLEHDNQPDKRFGIWANGILVETLPEAHLKHTKPRLNPKFGCNRSSTRAVP